LQERSQRRTIVVEGLKACPKGQRNTHFTSISAIEKTCIYTKEGKVLAAIETKAGQKKFELYQCNC